MVSGGSIVYTGSIIGGSLAQDIEKDGVLNGSNTPEENAAIYKKGLATAVTVGIKNRRIQWGITKTLEYLLEK